MRGRAAATSGDGVVAETVSARGFRIGLALITLTALAIRIGAAIWYDTYTTIEDDAIWYTGVATALSNGDGFIEPLHAFGGVHLPTAAHPPLYAIYLTPVEIFGFGSTLSFRLWSCLPGTGTVLVLGLVGRMLAGRRAGLIAAGLAAVFVELFAQDVRLWSEGLYGFTIALTILLAYRYLRRPDLLHAALLGGVIALATLTRAEAALLFLILVVPLVLRVPGQEVARRIGALAVAAVVALVFIAPWLVYNNTGGRFEEPVGITTTLGLLIGTSNCEQAYYGRGIGDWGGFCYDIPRPPPDDESVHERLARDAGIEYAKAHAGRLPVVFAARLGRSFGVFAPKGPIAHDLLLEDAKVHQVSYLVLAQYWLYLGVGIAGGVVLFRRRVALLPLVAPVITVAVISVLGFGTMRFRMALDVVLPIVAAVAVDHFLTRRAERPTGTGVPVAAPS